MRQSRFCRCPSSAPSPEAVIGAVREHWSTGIRTDPSICDKGYIKLSSALARERSISADGPSTGQGFEIKGALSITEANCSSTVEKPLFNYCTTDCGTFRSPTNRCRWCLQETLHLRKSTAHSALFRARRYSPLRRRRRSELETTVSSYLLLSSRYRNK